MTPGVTQKYTLVRCKLVNYALLEIKHFYTTAIHCKLDHEQNIYDTAKYHTYLNIVMILQTKIQSFNYIFNLSENTTMCMHISNHNYTKVIWKMLLFYMMTSTNGNVFRVTGPLCGGFTGHRWIPLTKCSNTELWYFLWSAPEFNGRANNRDAGDMRRHRAHYDVTVMRWCLFECKVRA